MIRAPVWGQGTKPHEAKSFLAFGAKVNGKLVGLHGYDIACKVERLFDMALNAARKCHQQQQQTVRHH